MERARKACLWHLGFPLTRLKQRHSILFVVAAAPLKYLSAARLDDELEVTLEILRLGRAFLVFRQQTRRGDRVLVNGDTFTPLPNAGGTGRGTQPVVGGR